MATHTWEGQVKWFKALGEPRENFNKDGYEWSFQISVGSAEKLLFRQNKVKKSIKFDEELGDFVNLSLPAADKKGNPNKPIKVEDGDGVDWPSDKWIGNGSKVKVTCKLDSYSFVKDGQKIEGCKLIPVKAVVTDYVAPPAKGATQAAKPKRTDTTNWTDDTDDE